MTTINAPALMPGLPYPAAVEVARQMNAVSGADAAKLSALGIPGPVAIELAAQIAAYTGNANRLIGLGVNPTLANALATAASAAND